MSTKINERTQVGSNHPGRITVLVLETDEVFPDTRDRKGSFGQIFHDVFSKAGEEHDPKLELQTKIKFVVENEGGHVPEGFADLEGVQGVLITGSKWDAHGDDEWIVKLVGWIQKVWKDKPEVRFSGVCFGHQVLCRALGSKVEPTPGEKWELSHTKISLTSIGEKLFQQKAFVHLHQMHQDHVVDAPSSSTTSLISKSDDPKKVGKEVAVWGSTEETPIQGVYLRERLFTTQGHLGYDEKMVKLHVKQRYENGSLEDEKQAEEALKKAGKEHDGVLVAGAILRFFGGEDAGIE